MSEYGLRIANFEAGSIYEVMTGVRSRYDTTEAMFTHSLFSDFIRANGLNVHKGESTRDIICVEFNYGSRSLAEEKAHRYRSLCDAGGELDKALATKNLNCIAEAYVKAERTKYMYDHVEDVADQYEKKSANELREMFYENGIDIWYGKNKIHYCMLYRTPGKAKKGSCMFIRQSLYKRARDFLYMGIKLPKKNAPLVEIGAYSSLVTSAIENRIRIEPENILILKDVDAVFNTRVLAVDVDAQGRCFAEYQDNYPLKNTMFDGQALIDEAVFPDYGNGYVLLRHHFCKMAAFVSRLQLFFRDKYGDDYETAEVTDMFGIKHRVKDIKLITTDNAMKWLKFPVTYKYWCDWVHKNDCMFGVVKTAHESKMGEYQRMSYQMINSLDVDNMDGVMTDTVNYILQLKRDDGVFLDFLDRNKNFSNDYEPLVRICQKNPSFVRSDYYRERKRVIIREYVKRVKFGKVLQNADNLVIVGSPYAMLLHAVGESALSDPTFAQEKTAIQCWTERFSDGEYLAEFRSPFNSRNNLGFLHNKSHPLLKKYFPFGKQIIAVNMIGTGFQDRNNGSDQDSDSIYVTNQPDIVAHAEYCTIAYPTVVNNIPKSTNVYNNTPYDFAAIDNKLAAAQLAIGESSNLAQLCLSYTYNFDDPVFVKYAAILAVIAQASIDSTKRTFAVDIPEEIKRIKTELNIKANGYPEFWLSIRKGFDAGRINKNLKCPMNFVASYKYPEVKPNSSTVPFERFIKKHPLTEKKRIARKIEALINKYSLELYRYNVKDDDAEQSEYLLLKADFEMMVSEIQRIVFTNKYVDIFYWLINKAFLIDGRAANHQSKVVIAKNRSLLMKTLYTVNSEAFMDCFCSKLT